MQIKFISYIAIILVFFIVGSFHFQTYPFYFAWDMDLITIQDLILINSGKQPIHVNHTSNGMYLFYHLTDLLKSFLNLGFDLSERNLNFSLEPLLLIADRAFWLRFENFAIVLTIPLVLSQITLLSFKHSTYLSLIGTILLFSAESIWGYNIHLIRSENFSIILQALALTLIAFRTPGKWTLRLLLCKYFLVLFLSVLGFTTKIQSFLLMVIIIFLTYVDFQNEILKRRIILSGKVSRTLLSLLSIAFIISTYVAYRFNHHPDIVGFEDKFQVNKFFFVVIIFSLLLLLIDRIKPFAKKMGFVDFNCGRYVLSLTILAVFVSLAACSYISADSSVRWALFNTNFKMIFLRLSEFNDANVVMTKYIVGNLKQLISTHLYLFLPASILLILLRFKRNCSNLRLRNVFFISSVLLILHCIIFVRPTKQDFIWVELPLIVYIIISAGYLFNSRICSRPYITVGMTILTLLSLNKMVSEIKLPNPFIGQSEYLQWTKEVYERDIQLYSEILNSYDVGKAEHIKFFLENAQSLKNRMIAVLGDDFSMENLSFYYNNIGQVRTFDGERHELTIGKLPKDAVIFSPHDRLRLYLNKKADVDILIGRLNSDSYFEYSGCSLSRVKNSYSYEIFKVVEQNTTCVVNKIKNVFVITHSSYLKDKE